MGKYFFKSLFKPNSGVTLIESVVAIFLTLTAFAALFQMFSFGYLRVKGVKNRLSAIHLCQEKMESLLDLPYTSIALYSQTQEEVTIDYGADSSSDEDDLKGTRTVQTLEDWIVDEELVGKKVIITVAWKRNNKDLSETLITAVYDGHNQ